MKETDSDLQYFFFFLFSFTLVLYYLNLRMKLQPENLMSHQVVIVFLARNTVLVGGKKKVCDQ